jgi:hypothetical protein
VKKFEDHLSMNGILLTEAPTRLNETAELRIFRQRRNDSMGPVRASAG